MKVLLSPMDWGLGHTTRCIPVIRALIRANVDVVLAGSPSSLFIFREEFPQLELLESPRYDIHYPCHGSEMPLWVMKNQKSFHHTIREEHEWVELMVAKHGFDRVISDNRFGFYSKKVPSAYITHQLRIAFPFPFGFLEFLGILWHQKSIRNFSEVWIPDVARFPGIAGKLSHVSSKQNYDYVGPLSRFSPPMGENVEKEIDILAILSGPEPMRSQFELKLKKVLRKIPGNHVMILGRPGLELVREKEGNIRFYSHLETEKFSDLVMRSKRILSRSGYSTIMDMLQFEANCVFIPTPGQTEQLYLARLLAKQKMAGYVSQKSISVQSLKALFKKEYRLKRCLESNELLEKVVLRFVESS